MLGGKTCRIFETLGLILPSMCTYYPETKRLQCNEVAYILKNAWNGYLEPQAEHQNLT